VGTVDITPTAHAAAGAAGRFRGEWRAFFVYSAGLPGFFGPRLA
jgi:hypothetical protein